jgi:hypothetical protein
VVRLLGLSACLPLSDRSSRRAVNTVLTFCLQISFRELNKMAMRSNEEEESVMEELNVDVAINTSSKEFLDRTDANEPGAS